MSSFHTDDMKTAAARVNGGHRGAACMSKTAVKIRGELKYISISLLL